MTLPDLNKKMSIVQFGWGHFMPETIALQWFLAFLFSAPYVTREIQMGQNQDKKYVDSRI